MLYTYALTAIVAGAVAFGAAWQVQDWRFDSERLAAQVNQRATERLRRQNANTAAVAYEAARETVRTEFVTIQERVNVEVEKPVYRNICIDSGGLRELANAARATGYTGEPGDSLPADQAPK